MTMPQENFDDSSQSVREVLATTYAMEKHQNATPDELESIEAAHEAGWNARYEWDQDHKPAYAHPEVKPSEDLVQEIAKTITDYLFSQSSIDKDQLQYCQLNFGWIGSVDSWEMEEITPIELAELCASICSLREERTAIAFLEFVGKKGYESCGLQEIYWHQGRNTGLTSAELFSLFTSKEVSNG